MIMNLLIILINKFNISVQSKSLLHENNNINFIKLINTYNMFNKIY